MRVLLDTSVLIDFSCNRRKAVDYLKHIGVAKSFVCSYLELLGGERKERKQQSRKTLHGFGLPEFTPAVNKLAYTYAMKIEYSGSRAMDLLIGATAISNKVKLVTTNTRHFKDLPGIELIEYKTSWQLN